MRRPQLSRALNEEALSAALTDALAPLEQTVLDDVAEGYRGLERDRDELLAIEESAKAVATFNQVHRREVAIRAGRLADGVRSAHRRYDEAQGAVRAAQEARAGAQAALAASLARLAAAERDRKEAEGASRALSSSPQMRTAERLDRLRQDVERACRRAETDTTEATRSDQEAGVLSKEAGEAAFSAEAARAELSVTAARAQTAGSAVGIPAQEDEQPALRRRRLTDGLRRIREAAKALEKLDGDARREQELCTQAEQRVGC